MGSLFGGLFAQQQAPEAAEVKYVLVLVAAIASIVVAVISACVSVVGLLISRMNQSALQRQQAELMQSNQRELENLKAQLTLKTQNELEKAKSELTERTQVKIEAVKADLQHRTKVAGLVGDNRLKAAEVLTSEFGSVASEVYAFQHLSQSMPEWAAQNRTQEVARIASLLGEAQKKFHQYTLYFDGHALKEIGTIYGELMSLICNDIGNKERIDKLAFRQGVVFTKLRQQLGIEPLSDISFGSLGEQAAPADGGGAASSP